MTTSTLENHLAMISHGAAPFMGGFTLHDLAVDAEITLRFATGGNGPALLLLHGHPQNHVTWHKIAPALAERFTVVAPDLRGYGDSSKPDGGEEHAAYSKRAMARDMVRLMRALGHERFFVVGHDRGGRVAHRMCLDYPDTVARVAFLDMAPTALLYDRTDREFATRYFWWFFFIQPYPLPERLIDPDPEYFLRQHITGQNKVADATAPEIFAEYLRCYRDPRMRHAVCEDYRAAASIDLKHDGADADKRVTVPALALWGGRGTMGALFDVLALWREKAVDVSGHALDCGHNLQEERPRELLDALLRFFPS